jgi:antitoxin component YwqK of YwqJK toxin-antitoxin module
MKRKYFLLLLVAIATAACSEKPKEEGYDLFNLKKFKFSQARRFKNQAVSDSVFQSDLDAKLVYVKSFHLNGKPAAAGYLYDGRIHGIYKFYTDSGKVIIGTYNYGTLIKEDTAQE